jgi:hypothetical protein
MEVFTALTPTYSGNLKPNLESFLVESVATRHCDFSYPPLGLNRA